MTGCSEIDGTSAERSMGLVLKLLIIKGGSSSVVERQLPKLNVAGSIPVSRSNINKHFKSAGLTNRQT